MDLEGLRWCVDVLDARCHFLERDAAAPGARQDLLVELRRYATLLADLPYGAGHLGTLLRDTCVRADLVESHLSADGTGSIDNLVTIVADLRASLRTLVEAIAEEIGRKDV